MANELGTAILILWMGALPLGVAFLSSTLRPWPALVPVRDGGWRVPGRGR
jgi:hypothetical protein